MSDPTHPDALRALIEKWRDADRAQEDVFYGAYAVCADELATVLDRPAPPPQDRELDDLRAWKASAMQVFKECDRLHERLKDRPEYLGWSAHEAIIDALDKAEAELAASRPAPPVDTRYEELVAAVLPSTTERQSWDHRHIVALAQAHAEDSALVDRQEAESRPAPPPVQLQDGLSPEWTCPRCGGDALWCKCPAPPVEDHKAAVEDMLAFGRGCKHDALMAKDREQYRFWGGYSAAMERIIALLTASRPAPEPASQNCLPPKRDESNTCRVCGYSLMVLCLKCLSQRGSEAPHA